MELETWKRLYNLFNPIRRLELSDQDLYVSRPGSVAEAIAADLRHGLEPEGKWVVCGSMGSGKSSELVHLGSLLDRSHVVVGLDLPESVARVDLIQPSEVLFLSGAAAVRTAREILNHEIDADLVARLLSAFKGLLSSEGHTVDLGKLLQGVALFAANLAAPGVGAVAGAAAGVAGAAVGALGEKAKTTLRRASEIGGLTRPVKEGQPDFERLREAVDDVLADLRGHRPPVVLVDGLDKIQELGAIRDLFATNRILALPRAQVVYTGPINLMLATEWQATGGAFQRARLTNVVVREPELEWVELGEGSLARGRETMCNIVARRLLRADLTPEQVFEGGALETLTEASGGLVRDLVHLVNRAVRVALQGGEPRVTPATARAAVQEIRTEYEVTLNTRRVDELRHVLREGEPSGAEGAHDLLLWGYILPYDGRDTATRPESIKPSVWFEPHPILRGLRPNL